MGFCWTLFVICLLCHAYEAKVNRHRKRDIPSSICDQVENNHKVQCYCSPRDNVTKAECFLVQDSVGQSDLSWDQFETLGNINKLTLTNARGITITYVPNILKYLNNLQKIEIKHANISNIQAFAFSNLSKVEEINIKDDNVNTLEENAFSNHFKLRIIGLDDNNIVEINRNVFVNLPSLEKLYLILNKITTIHDKAFLHLNNLRELELEKNKIFSLNNETFLGLNNLQRLDLSDNSIEVIGDNTFQALGNLMYLDLENNKIQMLDEKAFHGLTRLSALSLAHNKLEGIDNVQLFKEMNTLVSLNLKDNKIRELKSAVMAPIINNFYGAASDFDIEDNYFPCDCRLEWFIVFHNKTQNNRTRTHLNNLKCQPDDNLRDLYNKSLENVIEETTEDKTGVVENQEFEYYDDTDLDGKLFYTDVRFLLNCSGTEPTIPVELVTTIKSQTTTKAKEASTVPTTVTVQKPITPAPLATVTKTNTGLLDLSIQSTTAESGFSGSTVDKSKNHNSPNEIKDEKKANSFTTTRLATVSAKPENTEEDMASDEAKPDNYKAHRSVKEEMEENTPPHNDGGRLIIHFAELYITLICLAFH